MHKLYAVQNVPNHIRIDHGTNVFEYWTEVLTIDKWGFRGLFQLIDWFWLLFISDLLIGSEWWLIGLVIHSDWLIQIDFSGRLFLIISFWLIDSDWSALIGWFWFTDSGWLIMIDSCCWFVMGWLFLMIGFDASSLINCFWLVYCDWFRQIAWTTMA